MCLFKFEFCPPVDQSAQSSQLAVLESTLRQRERDLLEREEFVQVVKNILIAYVGA
jgi:hypothetical protein